MLIDSFGLDKDMIEDFIIFAKNPEEDEILEMIDNIKNQESKNIFILDCMILANSDDNFGLSVAIHNDTIVVGVHGEDSGITQIVNKDGCPSPSSNSCSVTDNNNVFLSGAGYVFMLNRII
jgi:ribosomal protein S4E